MSSIEAERFSRSRHAVGRAWEAAVFCLQADFADRQLPLPHIPDERQRQERQAAASGEKRGCLGKGRRCLHTLLPSFIAGRERHKVRWWWNIAAVVAGGRKAARGQVSSE